MFSLSLWFTTPAPQKYELQLHLTAVYVLGVPGSDISDSFGVTINSLHPPPPPLKLIGAPSVVWAQPKVLPAWECVAARHHHDTLLCVVQTHRMVTLHTSFS